MSKSQFTMDILYESVIKNFEIQLETQAKYGKISPSLPDILIDKIKEILMNPYLIEDQQPMQKLQCQGSETGDTSLAQQIEGIKQCQPVIDPIYQQEQDQDQFQMFRKLQDKQKQQASQAQSCIIKSEDQTPLPLKNPKIQQPIILQQNIKQQQDPQLLQYIKMQQERDNRILKLRYSSQATIFATIRNNKLKKYVKPKNKDFMLLLDLSEIFVQQTVYPYKQDLFNVRGLVTLKQNQDILKEVILE